jgi:hypothetical protein
LFLFFVACILRSFYPMYRAVMPQDASISTILDAAINLKSDGEDTQPTEKCT